MGVGLPFAIGAQVRMNSHEMDERERERHKMRLIRAYYVGLYIRCTGNALHHTFTGSFSAVSTPIFASK